MKVVNTENIYRIYADNLRTFDTLPVQTYIVRFSPKTGFSLETSPNLKITEKIYGEHDKKALKILNTFKIYKRNLGVILSGDKGIGKSICAKLLAQHAIEQGYPVILVNEYVPGIADFLSSIEQEAAIVFDEFDKTFNNRSRRGEVDSEDSQVEMLTLFDGLDQGKKLFIITCNELYGLNEYLVNRPGRFHYHLRFEYPNAKEIREYLQDNIKKEYYPEINKVVDFSSKINLNYDCLRSIAFELNLGSSFEDSIKDLNIVNVDRVTYTVSVTFTNGAKAFDRDVNLDFFGEDSFECWFTLADRTRAEVRIVFDLTKPAQSDVDGTFVLGPDSITDLEWDVNEENQEQFANIQVEKVTIKRKQDKRLHYNIA